MPQQKRRMRNRKIKGSLQNEHDSDSSDDIMEDIKFSIGMKSAEQEIMQLYKDKFKIDPIHDNTYKRFTEEEQVERYAQNIAFWQKLLLEYHEEDFESCTSDPRYFYIKMKESEVRVNAFRRFDNNKDVLRKIITRLLELVNNQQT